MHAATKILISIACVLVILEYALGMYFSSLFSTYFRVENDEYFTLVVLGSLIVIGVIILLIERIFKI